MRSGRRPDRRLDGDRVPGRHPGEPADDRGGRPRAPGRRRPGGHSLAGRALVTVQQPACPPERIRRRRPCGPAEPSTA